MRWLVVWPVVLLLSTLSSPALGAGVEEAWTETMQEVRGQLAAGHYAIGKRKADKLVDAMASTMTGGAGASRYLALALTLKAVGEAGVGDLDAAIWHWQVAQGLAPDTIEPALLADFGEAGAALWSHTNREVGLFADGTRPDHRESYEGPDFAPLRSMTPPPRLSAVWRAHLVEIELEIDEQGKPYAPLILESSLPSKTYLVLERARTSRFEPGRSAGAPTRTLGRFTIAADTGGMPAAPADLVGEARACLRRGEVATARCIYDAAQGLDPTISDAAFETKLAEALASRPSPASSEASPVHVGGEIQAPRKVHSPAPSYPERARLARDQGVVIVQAIIDKNGDVANVRMLKPLAFDLDLQAIMAICRWRFEPATLGGVPVDVYYNLTLNFRLQTQPPKRKKKG